MFVFSNKIATVECTESQMQLLTHASLRI